MCERAVSATSRGVSVASAHHVLKLVRKPCGRASSPRRFSTALSVMSEIGFPRLPTKTWLWRSNRFASCGTNWAADDNGTRCSFPAFILSAGMTQRSLCTSSNVKFLTSPDRAAVRIRKRKAKLVGVPAQRTRKTQVHPPQAIAGTCQTTCRDRPSKAFALATACRSTSRPSAAAWRRQMPSRSIAFFATAGFACHIGAKVWRISF